MSQHFIDFWIWGWRRLHAVIACRHVGWCERSDVWGIDAGYCIDRYSIEDEDGYVTVSRP